MSSTTTREMRREEYSSSNVIRSLQPSRPLSPYSQKSDFDNNLGKCKKKINFSLNLTIFLFMTDTILDDLQQSISRPGSSLGQPITNYSSHHRDVQFLQPANTTTVLRERSMSPNSNVNIEPFNFECIWARLRNLSF